MAKKITEVHSSIRKRLGYSEEQSVKEVLVDWKRRTTTVCKPCWELKYCPYGPLVEQLPLLPIPLKECENHNLYLKDCIESGTIGSARQIDEDDKKRLRLILEDNEFARSVAISQLQNEIYFEDVSNSEDPLTELGRPLPPLEQYRVSFEIEDVGEKNSMFGPEFEARIETKIEQIRNKARDSIETGIDDNRRPLDGARQALFQKQLDEFDPDNHPTSIPDIFTEAACNIFGHICPVFFAAESITETSKARRRGRNIPFSVKIRVVRRDNHTCQECGIHLRDDEVEFDHKIPISRGGSSEEHNIRLTCFDCNREKSAKVDI